LKVFRDIMAENGNINWIEQIPCLGSWSKKNIGAIPKKSAKPMKITNESHPLVVMLPNEQPKNCKISKSHKGFVWCYFIHIRGQVLVDNF